MKRRKSFGWSKLLYFPHSFWLIATLEFLLGGTWGCFLHMNSEYVKLHFHYEEQRAALVASTAQILPIFLMPFLGIAIDRFGKRTWIMMTSGVSVLVSLLLLEYTQLPPVIGMLVFSISLSLGPVSLVSSVPIILPTSLVGTGMGVIKSGTNIGSSLFDMASGLLQDSDTEKGYHGVILFFSSIALLAVFSGCVLTVVDWTMYSGLLNRSAHWVSQRRDDKLYCLPKSREKVLLNWLYIGIYVSLAFVCWISFFRFIILSAI